MKYKTFLLSSLLSISSVCAAHAAVGASQAAQLGTTLTQFGANPAASADGAIPAYTGGFATMSNLPAVSSSSSIPDPFAAEKPLFSVDASNMAQYAAMLTPGTQAMMQRYPDFRVDVYPTHRTYSYPAWVLQNTVKNASTAQEVGAGDGVTGAYGGIPFPIPQDGYQVMWNSFLQYEPPSCSMKFENYLVDTNGAVTDLGMLNATWAEPYYNQAASAMPDTFYRYYWVLYNTPVAEAGVQYLFKYPQDFTVSDDVTYYYTPGTRRVREAPEFKYDTPAASYGGAIDFDEIDLFYGRMDKFDFKLVGEKEMIVPYNDYKFAGTTQDDLLGPHHLNPDGVRWERHRVWIIDATLKADERHAYSRWTFYVDEDSWHILATETYDHSNAFYRVGYAYPYIDYGDGDGMSFSRTFGINDLSKGNYEISYVQTGGGQNYTCNTTMPNMSEYTAQSMAMRSVR
jgi:hypothetical protein